MKTQTARKPPHREKELRFKEVIRIVLIAIVVAFLITHFMVSSTVVDGSSMEDTLHNGDRLFVWKRGMDIPDLERGDIVVFHAPDENRDYIKRVIAFPNEYVQIEDGMVYINGKRLEEDYINTSFTHTSTEKEWLVGEGDLFVLGDNRQEGASKDSRYFGTIHADSLVGKAVFRYYPFDQIGGL